MKYLLALLLTATAALGQQFNFNQWDRYPDGTLLNGGVLTNVSATATNIGPGLNATNLTLYNPTNVGTVTVNGNELVTNNLTVSNLISIPGTGGTIEGLFIGPNAQVFLNASTTSGGQLDLADTNHSNLNVVLVGQTGNGTFAGGVTSASLTNTGTAYLQNIVSSNATQLGHLTGGAVFDNAGQLTTTNFTYSTAGAIAGVSLAAHSNILTGPVMVQINVNGNTGNGVFNGGVTAKNTTNLTASYTQNAFVSNSLDVGGGSLKVDSDGNLTSNGQIVNNDNMTNNGNFTCTGNVGLNTGGGETTMSQWSSDSGGIFTDGNGNIGMIGTNSTSGTIGNLGNQQNLIQARYGSTLGGNSVAAAGSTIRANIYFSDSSQSNSVSLNDNSVISAKFGDNATGNTVFMDNSSLANIDLNGQVTNCPISISAGAIGGIYMANVSVSNSVQAIEGDAIWFMDRNAQSVGVSLGNASFGMFYFENSSNIVYGTGNGCAAGGNFTGVTNKNYNLPDGYFGWGTNQNGDTTPLFSIEADGWLSAISVNQEGTATAALVAGYGATTNYTNFVNLGTYYGNGAGITNVTPNAPTLIQTNFLTGTLYNNTYGRPIQISASASLTTAAVAGMVQLSLEVAGQVTNRASVLTAIGVVAGTATNAISSAIVPVGGTWYFRNTSSGTGDTAAAVGGQILVF